MLTLLTQNSYLWLSGIETTLLLTLGGIVLGGLLSLILTGIKIFKIPVLFTITNLYLFIIRGTPFLVQLYIIYYGQSQLNSGYFCALIALAINTSAYTTVLFCGAIENLPKDEMIAANALGMRKTSILFYIIFPRMFKRILPAYLNEILMILKCTALVSSVSILDLMGVTRQVMSSSYKVIPSLIIAGVFYVVMALMIEFLFSVSKRYYENN